MSYARKLHFPPLELKGPVSRTRIWYEFHLAHIKQIWLAQQLFSQGFSPLCKVPGRADGALRVLRGDQTRASFNNTGTDTPVNGKRQSKENLIFFLWISPFISDCLGELFKHLSVGKGTNPSIWRVYYATFFWCLSFWVCSLHLVMADWGCRDICDFSVFIHRK